MRTMNLEFLTSQLEDSILETVLEISAEVIWVMNVTDEKEFKWITTEEKRMKYGIPEKVTTIDFWLLHLHPKDKLDFLNNIQKAFQDPYVTNFEHTFRFLGSEENYFFINDKMKFFRDSKGQLIKVIGVWRDITNNQDQRVLLKEELINANRQLSINLKELSEREFILNQSQRLANIASWEYDIENKTMRWSEEMYRIYGVDKTFQVNDPSALYHLYDPETASLIAELFNHVDKPNNLPFDITTCIHTPGGFIKWVRITAYPFLENGNMKRILGLTYDITQFKETEERLKRSEEKFSKIFQNNPDLTTIHNESNFVILDVNKNAQRVLGYNREEVVGRNAKDFNFFVIADDRIKFYSDYNSTGYSQIETLWRKKDGTIMWAQITSTRLEINKENYSLNIIKDITAEKAALKKFRKAFDLSPGLMIIMRERDLKFIDVNAKVEEIFGYKQEAILGKTTLDFDIWANIEDRTKYYSILDKNGSVAMETTLRKRTGEHFYAFISTERIMLSGEKHYLLVVHDITEKKQAEIKLKESEAKLNSVINNTDLSIWSIDNELRITTTNHAFRQSVKDLFGVEYKPGEFIRDESKKNIPKDLQEYWLALYQRALNGESVSVEFEFNGSHHLTSLHPIIEDNKVIGASIYARDITEKKKAEEKLLLSEANLAATINNTKLFVLSVNSDLNLIMFNEPFKKYVKETYDIEIELGKTIIPSDHPNPEFQKTKSIWTERYRRALAGENLKITEQIRDKTFEYSLNQIIERDKITGVSVFAEDITERVKRETELADANKKIGELKLMALRSVMNPHFIFNALNSIQYFILNNDRMNAINYLSTFSRLVRSILSNTIQNKIKLSEEVEQLNYYINLEQLRFEDKFIFKLKIDEHLNLEEIKIPSLLIQPYVENAILHGLCNKEGNGILSVTISKDTNGVLFEIEDDGIGREAAMKLRQYNLQDHKSMGTALTEERLKLINAQNEVSFEIIDLKEEERAAGTKVRIWVRE